MLDYCKSGKGLERLRAREAGRPIYPSQRVAAKANVGPTVDAADALLGWIEASDIAARFVPDWADEHARNAA